MKVLALFKSFLRLRVLLVSFLFLTVAGSAHAAKSITLAWDPSTDSKVTGYNIYYGPACAQYTNHVWVSGVATTNATINNLLDGVTYYFAATSCGSAGDESPFSNEVNYQSAPVVTQPVAPSITWTQPAAIVYGTALSAAQLNATANAPGTFTYNPALNSVLPAGNGQTLTAVFTPTDPTKYTSVTTTVLLNVSKAPLTITANSGSKAYGAAVPALTAVYSGFVNGNTAASLTTPVSLSTTATAASPIGTYTITASGATSPNYTITFVNASLNVTRAALTIAADAKSKCFGAALPVLTATYSGFVNGDTAASLTTPVSLSTTATAASPIGTYAITASGATSPNYTIAFVNGSLNVTPAALTIAADAKSKTYGAANPAFTATYSGFVNGDTAASLTTPVSLSTTATAASPIGTYTITASGATSPNYTIAFVNGSLNVTPAALTIAADAKSKTYGAALPVLTATYSGFVNGDTAASLTTPVSLTTTATAASHVGSYNIIATGAASPNYTISFANSSLNVTPAALTITANCQSRLVNTANPALTASYAGFVNGESASSLTTPVSLTTTATTSSPVGTYPIIASGAQDADYTITLVNGTLTVTATPVASLVSIAVAPNTTSLLVGQTAQFTATGTYSDGASSNLTSRASWMTSAGTIASVSGTGLATGLTAGNAIISATMSGMSSSATLTVKSNTPSGSVTLTSTVARTIPTIGLANPYVTTINASGLAGVLSKVTVTLNGVSHTWPHDINAMLVGPAGQKVMLMRHAGGGYKINNIAITLDDDANVKMPNYSGLKTGVYKPTNYGTIYNFASPAPSAPYDTKLSVFNRTNPNGTWSLYVMDDSSGDAGSMAGWSLTLTTTTTTLLDIPMAGPEPETPADLLAVKPNITTPPAVWIESIGLNTDKQASLILSGCPDANYTVQSTTNFVDWSEVESGIVPVGQFTVTDLQSGPNAGKFYRVVAP